MVRIASPKSSIKQRRRKRMLLISSVIFAILLALFCISLWVSNTSWLRITGVTVSGENVIPKASIEAVVKNDISGRYLGVYSKANIFFYPKEKIEMDLKALYPTLGEARVRAQDFHTITISVTERTPYALWCSSSDAASNDCALLDDSGLAYAHAPEYSGHVYETYIGALPAGPLPKQFLTAERFHSLSALVDTFAKKIAPDTVTMVKVDENNDVRLETSGGYDILFALDADGGKVFETFTLTLTAAPFTTHKLSDFQYIDMRFGDKVYYKLKS